MSTQTPAALTLKSKLHLLMSSSAFFPEELQMCPGLYGSFIKQSRLQLWCLFLLFVWLVCSSGLEVHHFT